MIKGLWIYKGLLSFARPVAYGFVAQEMVAGFQLSINIGVPLGIMLAESPAIFMLKGKRHLL